jgi:hypothetical protein
MGFFAQASDTVISNPVSDLFYDLLPILGVTAVAVLVAFRKRIEAWGEQKREDRYAPIMDELADIKRRLPPTAEEEAEARATLERVNPADDPP